MRQIIFRGIAVGDLKTMVYGYYYFDSGNHYIVLKNSLIRKEIDPKTLGQFTCLQDIAGTDCFEGDIIKAVWSEDINDELHGIGKVIFNCGCFMIEWIDDPESKMELLGMIYKTGRPRVFQIITNIFESPGYTKNKFYGENK